MRIVPARVPGTDVALTLSVHEHNDKHVSQRIVAEGVWEPFETEIIRRLLASAGPDPLFVDCGANLGWYSVVAASLGASVLAFEPMPANAALLHDNVIRNGFAERVVVVEAAVGATPGTARLELSAQNQGDHRVVAAPTGKPFVDVPVTTLDFEIERAFPARRPAVIKIDTQGSEVAILRGGRHAWRPSPIVAFTNAAGEQTQLPRPDQASTALVIEFWPYGLSRCGATAAELLELLGTLTDTHRFYEIVEMSGRLFERSIGDLERIATSRGFTELKGFTNLLVATRAQVEELHLFDDLLDV